MTSLPTARRLITRSSFSKLPKAEDHFDFVPTNGNLERMIREAEVQSADVVAGSYVNENGHWKNSCFQFNIRPWEITINNGYHKSLRGAMYCDGSFGPILLRI